MSFGKYTANHQARIKFLLYGNWNNIMKFSEEDVSLVTKTVLSSSLLPELDIKRGYELIYQIYYKFGIKKPKYSRQGL